MNFLWSTIFGKCEIINGNYFSNLHTFCENYVTDALVWCLCYWIIRSVNSVVAFCVLKMAEKYLSWRLNTCWNTKWYMRDFFVVVLFITSYACCYHKLKYSTDWGHTFFKSSFMNPCAFLPICIIYLMLLNDSSQLITCKMKGWHLHNNCMCTMFIYYVYTQTHAYIYIYICINIVFVII